MSVCRASSLPLFRQVRRVIGFRDVWLTRNGRRRRCFVF